MLPADSHVHSEWSWDTGGPAANPGRMDATCEQAIRIGLGTIIFTEHLDFGGWVIDRDQVPDQQLQYLTDDVRLRSSRDDGVLRPSPLDVTGYLDCIDRCRRRYPELRILTGVEYGQPHLFDRQAAKLLDLSALDRVNGSLHTLSDGGERSEPFTLFRRWPADRVIRSYLAEVQRMVAGPGRFAVFTHIDYPVRHWPAAVEGPFDPRRFEDEFRQAMRAIAGSGRALEMNTRRLWPWIPQWWAEEGGRAVTFGSDAHTPDALASGFGEATAMVEYFGFRPGRRPEDFWTR